MHGAARVCTLLVAFASLTACELIGPKRVAEPPAASSAIDVIEYANELRALDEPALEELHEELRVQNQESASSESTLRLALLLSYPESRHYDLDRAINLMNQVARSRRAEDPVFRSLAELMAAVLIERRSVAVDRRSLRERIAANADQIETLQAELEQTRAALTRAEERSAELENQLDALIELEQQLNGREDTANDGE